MCRDSEEGGQTENDVGHGVAKHRRVSAAGAGHAAPCRPLITGETVTACASLKWDTRRSSVSGKLVETSNVKRVQLFPTSLDKLTRETYQLTISCKLVL